MTITNELLQAFNRKSMQSIEDFLLSVRQIIMENTPESLHKRINEKFRQLKIDKQDYGRSSEFDEKTNTLFISPSHIADKNVYLHEIMHFIGTELNNDKINIGLNCRNYFKIGEYIISSNFGYGANEGLNQHYTEDFIKKHDKISPVSPEYSFCANIMSSLENLVGGDNFKIAHLGGQGILKLIDSTVDKCHLPNQNKIIKLILQLDAYKTIARTYIAFGVTYSPDMRIVLVDAYKTLITIALMQAKAQGKIDILFSEIITPAHLKGDNFDYFVKYIQKDLIQYFYQEKHHIFSEQISNFEGVNYSLLTSSTKQVFEIYLQTKTIDSQIIPEQLKCGEFYNHIFLGCMINDQKLDSKVFFTSDFQGELCKALFDINTNLVPNFKKERVQLVTQILASRNIVRSGVEICDDYIIDACSDKNFCSYLMDTDADTFRNIFPYIDNSVKQNPELVYKMLNEVFKTNVQLYKFEKAMQDILDKNQEIKQIYDIFKYSDTDSSNTHNK